jgi:lipopolysaccharide export system permease protein
MTHVGVRSGLRAALGFRPTILDRYMLSELAGPFGFGLSAFTLIFAATQMLSIGRLVSEDHVPLFAAIALFLWQLPGEIVLVIPMALLLGTLLAIQRLSGESEINAMKTSGIMFWRIIAPLLFAGLVMSLVMYGLQEGIVPFANDQVSSIENDALNHTSAFNRDLTVSAPIPGGGRQVTIATAYDPNSQALLHVTLVQYDRVGAPTQIIFADEAQFAADQWLLKNASAYRFNPDGTTISEPNVSEQEVDLGEKPTDIVKRISHDDPEQMSRSQIAAIVATGQLTETELRKYITVYQEKLAQPFACFVFVLIAIPFGLRSFRGGGNVSLGFGLAVLIVFVYYVVMTVFSYVGEALTALAPLWAWAPNIIFTAIGAARLRRAAAI